MSARQSTSAYPKKQKQHAPSVQETPIAYASTPPTFESVWRMFQETDKQWKETDKRFQETDRKLNKLESLFTSQWGKLMESLVEGDLVPLLRGRGIEVERTVRRVSGCRDGVNYEFDIIAIDGDAIVIVEVKTTLGVSDVKAFIKKLAHVREWMTEYAQRRVFGAVAYQQTRSDADTLAAKHGLFVIRATGSSASITNSPAFKPKAF